MRKISWQVVFNDFKKTCNYTSWDIECWFPSDYLKIEVRMKDGRILYYDYLNKEVIDNGIRWRENEPDVIRKKKHIRSDAINTIINRMRELDVSQKDICDISGIPKSTLSRYLSKERMLPYHKGAIIADILDININELYF